MISAGSRHQATQNEIGGEDRSQLDEVKVVLQKQRIDERAQRKVNRIDCFVQGCFAFKFADLSAFPHNLQHEAPDQGIILLSAGPVLRRCKCGDVIELSITEEQIHPGSDQRFHQTSKTFGRRDVLCINGLFYGRDDFRQAIAADSLTNRLLGIKKLVDVRLGKPDRFRQVGNRSFAIAVLTEVLIGRRDDLIPDLMIGWATDAGGSYGCLVHTS